MTALIVSVTLLFGGRFNIWLTMALFVLCGMMVQLRERSILNKAPRNREFRDTSRSR